MTLPVVQGCPYPKLECPECGSEALEWAVAARPSESTAWDHPAIVFSLGCTQCSETVWLPTEAEALAILNEDLRLEQSVAEGTPRPDRPPDTVAEALDTLPEGARQALGRLLQVAPEHAHLHREPGHVRGEGDEPPAEAVGPQSAT